MAFDVGRVSIEYLDRPSGMAYEFVKHLAEQASCTGDGNAFGFYRRSRIKRTAREFLIAMQAEPEEIAEVMRWLNGLPWDREGYLVLTFNW